ncbi:MAG: dephospho-CoA kinase, dephospho-CoA kinase [Deltaproteobacteria bacterium CSP1-8]|nr:MAG: dephospho-CoA kinase, dephospho-CoA kinase [Deltaproteobacteria bacterium CSP1-8]
MRVFGLTGGICSGKSTVARFFREEGIPVVDADRISREITLPGMPAHADIVRKFGGDLLLPDGRIDRKKLGAIVFADPGKRAELEAVTHPRIALGIREAVSALAAMGHSIAIVEAALIHEKGRSGMFEAVIGVGCDRGSQVERLMNRDGIPREEALRIVSAQMDPEEKARASDYVIDNSGDLATTRARVRALARKLRVGRGHSSPASRR